MYENTGHISIRRTARVVASVRSFRVLDLEPADGRVVAGLLQGDGDPLGREVDHPGVVVPEDVRRGLGAVRDDARQVDLTAHAHVEVAAAQDFGFGHWE